MPNRTIRVGRQYRDVAIRAADIDEEKRTVELSFSSEEPVERWFGIEVLDHKRNAVNLERLKDKGPLLLDHSTRDHVGVIERAWLDNKRGMARVRFSKSARGEEVFQDIQDGIRSHVSVGYQVHELTRVEGKNEGPDQYRVTSWEPLEISIVSVPADPSVGIGRSAGGEERDVTIIEEKDDDMPEKTKEQNQSRTDPGTVPATPVQPAGMSADERSAELKRLREEDGNRVREIRAIGAQWDMRDAADKAVADDVPVDRFRAEVMGKLADQAKPLDLREADGGIGIGLSEREASQFSFLRAIRASMEQDWSGAGFEREVSQAAAKLYSKDQRSNGFVVPPDVMLAKRVMTTGVPADGGNLVGTDHLAGSFIELLRNRMMVRMLGATVLDGLIGNVDIPKQTGSATMAWAAEDVAAAESAPTVGQVPLGPKTATVWTDMSRRLLMQSSPSVEQMVRNDLAASIGLGLDLAAINGSGAGSEPTGILQTAGIGAVALGANGAAPTWADIVALESEVAIDNADIGNLAYLTNAAARGKLKTTPKEAGQAIYVWGDGNEPGFGMMNGYRAGASNQVPSTLTKGTSVGVCSAILYGNWADLIIGMWGALDVLVDPYTKSTTGAVRIVNHQDVDIAVRHAESFAAITDALTA